MTGDGVSSQYDSLVAKLISTANTREQAMSRLQEAISKLELTGIRSNIALLTAILSSQQFNNAQATLNIVAECLAVLKQKNFNLEQAAAFFAVTQILEHEASHACSSAWQNKLGFRLSGNAGFSLVCTIFDRDFNVTVTIDTSAKILASVTSSDKSNHKFSYRILGSGKGHALISDNQKTHTLVWRDNLRSRWLSFGRGWFCAERARVQNSSLSTLEANLTVTSPLPGKIVALAVKNGQSLGRHSKLPPLNQ